MTDWDADFSAFEQQIIPEQGRRYSSVKIPGNPSKNISVRQNNPFNLKYVGQPDALGAGTRGFAIYATPEAGVQAGINQIMLDQNRGLTFGQFAEKYAPAYENPTWASDVSRALGGVHSNTPIAQIPTMALAHVIARRESSTDIGGWNKRVTKTAATVPDLDTDFAEFEKRRAKDAVVQKPEQSTEPEIPWSLQKIQQVANLPGIRHGLWLVDLPNRLFIQPVKEAAVEKMMQVPALAQEQEVPIEGLMPEMLAGGKGLSGTTVKTPPLAKTIGETGATLAVGPVYGAVGKALGFMRTIPGINKIKGIGKAPVPGTTIKELQAEAVAAKTAAEQAAQQAKLEKVAGLKETVHEPEIAPAKPWELKAKMEDIKKVEPQPSTPIEAATVESMAGIQTSEGLPTTPERMSFQQVANAITGGQARRPRGIEVPPTPVETARAIKPAAPPLKKDLNLVEQELMSNNIVAANKWGTINNPINDYADGITKYVDRRLRYEGWLNDTVKKFGLWDDIKASVREGQNLLAPILERFIQLREPELVVGKKIAALGRQYGKLNPESEEAMKLKELVGDLAHQRTLRRKEIQKEIGKIYADRQLVLNHLMKKYPNVRIKLAAGGNEKAAKLLNDQEKQIVAQTRKYYDLKKAELEKQGLRTIGEDYVNFVFNAPLMQAGKGKPDIGAMAFAQNLWYSKQKLTPEMLTFISRTPGAKDWFPFWYQSLKQYIPSVERKLSFNPFLSKWTAEASKWEVSHPRAFNWFNDFLQKNFSMESSGTLNRAFNSLINLEYARTLVGNIAAPVLHLFKLFQTPAWHGPIQTMKGTYRFTKAMGQKALGLQGPERQALELYVRLPALMKSIEQSPGMERVLKPRFWRTWGMAPTAAIEYLDNGINLMSSIERGVKAGASPELIHKVNLDTLMRLNFRGFNMPPFMSGTGGRAAFMYLGQPTKLLENKIDLLVKGLRGQKDEFGGRDFWKFIRLATLLGSAYAVGQSQGVDLMKHVFHFPGEAVATKTGEETISLFTPPMELAYQLKTEGPKSALYQHFLNVPGLDRIMRLKSGQVTPRFNEPWTQFVGIPKAGWKEEYKERLAKSTKRQEKYRRKHRTPTQEWWDELMGR